MPEAAVTELPENAARGIKAAPAPPVPSDLVSALAEAMLNSADVAKDAVNSQHNYSYASGDAILAAVRVPLLSAGIILTAQPVEWEITEIKGGADGGLSASVYMDFTFRHGSSGETLAITRWKGKAHDYPGDKVESKAYGVAVKTFVKSQWLLSTGGQDGGAPPAGPELPGWAGPARPEREREMVEVLTRVIGRPQAATIAKGVAESCGYIPDVLVAFARSIVNQLPTAAGEPPKAPPEETKDVAWARTATDETLERVAGAKGVPAARVGAANAELDRRRSLGAPSAKSAPGSIEHPKMVEANTVEDCARILRDAGCSCADPIKAEDDEFARDTHCPIKGHGDPSIPTPVTPEVANA